MTISLISAGLPALYEGPGTLHPLLPCHSPLTQQHTQGQQNLHTQTYHLILRLLM